MPHLLPSTTQPQDDRSIGMSVDRSHARRFGAVFAWSSLGFGENYTVRAKIRRKLPCTTEHGILGPWPNARDFL
jgi:hypothetical protein